MKNAFLDGDKLIVHVESKGDSLEKRLSLIQHLTGEKAPDLIDSCVNERLYAAITAYTKMHGIDGLRNKMNDVTFNTGAPNE